MCCGIFIHSIPSLVRLKKIKYEIEDEIRRKFLVNNYFIINDTYKLSLSHTYIPLQIYSDDKRIT